MYRRPIYNNINTNIIIYCLLFITFQSIYSVVLINAFIIIHIYFIQFVPEMKSSRECLKGNKYNDYNSMFSYYQNSYESITLVIKALDEEVGAQDC